MSIEVSQSVEYQVSDLEVAEPFVVENGLKIAEFRAFVAQNANLLVKSPHSPGLKAPLELLVNMCPVPVTEENALLFLAEAQAMVAQAANETEAEEQTEEDVEEEIQDEKETERKERVKELGKKSEAAKREDKLIPKEESREAHQSIAPNREAAQLTNRPAQSEVIDDAPNIKVKALPHPATAAAQPENEVLAAPPPAQKIETPPSPVLEIPQEISEAPALLLPDIEEVRGVHQNTETRSQQVTLDESIYTPEPALEFMPDRELADSSAATEEGLESSLVLNEEYQIPTSEVETNSIDLEAGEMLIEDAGEAEFAELQTSGEFPLSQSYRFFEDISEEQVGGGFSLAAAETPASNFQEYEAEGPEVVYELPLPVEEVEQKILEVAERIEALEAEEAEVVHEILDQIVLKTQAAQAMTETDVENQEATLQIQVESQQDVEAELKELFIQLLDRLEIDYSPELVESFVNISLKQDLSELIPQIKQREETKAPHDRGTHEVIKQLRVAISRIKKAVLHAYHVGRSALQLYSQQLFTVNAV